jgi:site-specific DNA-methyltransferase (adenine-specific)
VTVANAVSIFRDDALNIGAYVAPGTAALAYLDPPFNVGIHFGSRSGTGSRATSKAGYSDVWPSLEAYLAWLEPRARAAWKCVAELGSLWLHLDHRASHDAFHMFTRIAGRGAFRGEVIWLPGNGSKARTGLGQTHQTLLIFARTPDFTWNRNDEALREPYASTSLSMHFSNKDENGRNYRERVVKGKKYRYYADKGRAIGSVWADCPSMVANTPLRSETTGYPTQKPEKLLERIVRGTTHENDLLIDPFMGSGTTLAVARRLNRRALGLDIGELSFTTVQKRLGSVVP